MNGKSMNLSGELSPDQSLNAFERFTQKSVWPAYVGCLFALLYAVFVRFYEAANGFFIKSAGQLFDIQSANMASYIAGVIIMFCGFVLLGLVKPWGRAVPAWVPLIGGRKIHCLLMLVPTLICTAFLIAHAVTGIITKSLLLAGVITIHFSMIVFDIHSLALWDLLFYEPWFLIMGILAGLAAAHYAHGSGFRLSALRRGTILYLIFVILLSAFFVSSIVFDFADKISF